MDPRFQNQKAQCTKFVSEVKCAPPTIDIWNRYSFGR